MKAQQDHLFETSQLWGHFIGRSYKSIGKFLSEARVKGISRRIPAQIAQGMNFGDRVVLLRKDQGDVLTFGEMTIKSIILESEISQKVIDDLAAEGKATKVENVPGGGGGIFCQRECGCYQIGETWDVSCPLAEIVEKALSVGR